MDLALYEPISSKLTNSSAIHFANDEIVATISKNHITELVAYSSSSIVEIVGCEASELLAKKSVDMQIDANLIALVDMAARQNGRVFCRRKNSTFLDFLNSIKFIAKTVLINLEDFRLLYWNSSGSNITGTGSTAIGETAVNGIKIYGSWLIPENNRYLFAKEVGTIEVIDQYSLPVLNPSKSISDQEEVLHVKQVKFAIKPNSVLKTIFI